MKLTRLSQNRSSLLNDAISKLSPEVFSHPVWIRFGQKKANDYPSFIDDLLRAAKDFQADDPGATCQILLICAVFQNHVGQQYNALRTSQQAISLAESNNLARETIWTLWGACAISLQQGNYEVATRHLVDLQAAFHSTNEWILANLIDIFRQAVLQAGINGMVNHAHSLHEKPFEEMLTFLFDWLQHWGSSPQASELDVEASSVDSIHPILTRFLSIRTFLSIQHWQVRWKTLMLSIRSKLKFQWIRQQASDSGNQFSLRGSILNSLRHYLFHRKTNMQIPNTAQVPSISTNTITLREKPSSPITEPNTPSRAERTTSVASLAVHMLGAFSIAIGALTMKLPVSRNVSLFKYILLHHKKNTSREQLMDLFWPDAASETARNSLNVAIHSLRRALRAHTPLPLIVFEDGAYGIAPGLQVWLDVEEFERCVETGQRLEGRSQLTAAIAEYESAISLYQGDFLEQTPYEEWTIVDRERLRIVYLDTLDRLSQIYFSQERYAACITICQRILTHEQCREDAHALLMRCYGRQGQYYMALRQYQICVEALRVDLEVDPAPETTQLYERVRRREPI